MDKEDKYKLKMLGAMMFVMGIGGFFCIFMIGLAFSLLKVIFL